MTRGTDGAPRVSVLMPTFRHLNFIRRAIESLRAQTLESWELLVIDDASPDDTGRVVAACLADSRIRYARLERNVGLGAALNAGLAEARGEYIAYLPSDDVWHAAHLAILAAALDDAPDAVLAFSGVRYGYSRRAAGRIPGVPLQLVLTMHRRTS